MGTGLKGDRSMVYATRAEMETRESAAHVTTKESSDSR